MLEKLDARNYPDKMHNFGGGGGEIAVRHVSEGISKAIIFLNVGRHFCANRLIIIGNTRLHNRLDWMRIPIRKEHEILKGSG